MGPVQFLIYVNDFLFFDNINTILLAVDTIIDGKHTNPTALKDIMTDAETLAKKRYSANKLCRNDLKS